MQNNKEDNPRIMIAGPTASGKSSLAVSLAQQIDGEIISVDSRQCFKRIDIGTAKPSQADLKEIPHYNISVLDLTEEDSVADFKKRSDQYSAEIESKGKTVIYCGGSTLHLKSLIQPLDDIPKADPENIKMLSQEAGEKGLEYLYQKLEEVDPEYAEKMDGLNRQRIIRALDVWHQTGKPFSSFHSDDPVTLPERFHFFALHRPRKILHERISKRADQMFEAGLINETKQLLEEGYSRNLQAFNTVGYKQVIQFLDGEITKEQMIKDVKTATRRYAKRQITWLRRWPFVEWINMHEKTNEEAVSQIRDALKID
ncbi:tRNA (adenosine(37)-N6)-dimethylallyltransferase MiaA [Rhodohalobacter sulfatireducens]|uniref:tRNA dimethylallyltransferase n=1 Tax=Rhodohalobacter sulfatireducens TaxID=2911366 RepID=A0ABS9K9X5_9BACT|nr:tRNA (adenosine(37)-N6)-dimethylallyltransferase MiaA [Rhodohalobacter sulfatireducens]MCG2587649.1 tRNA (adenosine(37)-N6)-dimethylallyltransferase MiaA [Rhodohalobacter sulfatireducens]